MNSFQLEIKNEGNKFKPEYYLDLLIDGESFQKKIDNLSAIHFEDLKKSANTTGKFLIFTCSCGIADCGGWDYIDVIHELDKVIWSFNYGKDFYFEFPVNYYKGEIARITFEIENRKLTLEPKYVIEPE